MKVSPLDLRQLRFRTTFRGFDKAEVLALIAEVTDDYENALREVDRLRQEVSKMEALLNQHREHERDLRDTLITAQRVSDDIRTNADAQARQIVREAEGRSDLLLQKTQARLEDVQREIDGMKMKRREVETTLESTIASLRNTLEFVREQEQREREDKILLHRPRAADERSPMRNGRLCGEWLRETPDGVSLAVKVIPRAGVTKIAGTREGRLLIRLAAAPVDGAANDALIAFLSGILKVPATAHQRGRRRSEPEQTRDDCRNDGGAGARALFRFLQNERKHVDVQLGVPRIEVSRQQARPARCRSRR